MNEIKKITNAEEHKLIQALTMRGTGYVLLGDGCPDCGCHVFYARKGHKHNGCVACRLELAKNKSGVPTSTVMLADENGHAIYMGRACSKCKSKVRLVDAVYGAKNKGACRECAIEAEMIRQHGKEFGRVARAVNRALNGFIVRSIERSQDVRVAPRTMAEYFDLLDLVYRREHNNAHEKALGTGITYEIAHWFPASGGGTEFRGKATVDNLYLEIRGVNRQQGDSLPEEWAEEQVIRISMDDCKLITNSHEAHAAWKAAKPTSMTPEQEEEWQTKDRKKAEEHKELVREITRGAVDTIKLLEMDGHFEFRLRELETVWLRQVNKMTRMIDAARKRGESVRYLGHNQERLTIDAFMNGNARVYTVLQTLRQIADGEMILREKAFVESRELSTEEESQLLALKRQAAAWALDVTNYPRDLVMGFTSPILRILGNQLTWGTVVGEDGNHWMCAWKDGEELRNSIEDQFSPLDDRGEVDWGGDDVNHVFAKTKLVSPTSEPDFIFGPDNVKREYVHEAVINKRARMAREAIEAEAKAEHLASGQKMKADVLDGIPAMYEYLATHCDEYEMDLAMKTASELEEWAQNLAAEIDQACSASLVRIGSALMEVRSRMASWQVRWINNPLEIKKASNPF